MVTTLYLIRHGETEGNNIKRYKGSIDVPLSERGMKQMEKVARYLSQNIKLLENHLSRLGAIYCSDLSRSIKSAEIIAEPYSLNPVIIPELRERN